MAAVTSYFELHEFLASDTAKERGIDNTPTFTVVAHLDELRRTILDPMREAWGGPIKVTSRYRSILLNAAVHGVSNSAHLTGYAADIRPTDKRRTAKFILWAVGWLEDNGIKYDQAIDERVGGERWLHIAVRDNRGRQRQQNLVITL
jgi:hypothetical protein